MDIYKTELDYQRRKADIEHWETDDINKQKIISFLQKMEINDLSFVQLQKYAFALKLFVQGCKKDFENVTNDDIMVFLSSMNQLKLETKRVRYYSLKKFFESIGKGDIFKNNGIRFEKSSSKLPTELLTTEEIDKMILSCESIRDRAFIGTLYESGARIGEMLNCKLESATIDRYGAVLVVDGKTGQRRVRIVKYASLLANWIENHPLKEPGSWLWVTKFSRKSENMRGWNRLFHNGALKVLIEAAKRSGINKRIYPHLFRHSRATEISDFLTESQMKEMFGWQQSSSMCQVYIHRSGKNLDNALLKMNGLESKEEPNGKLKDSVITCPRCNMVNSMLQRFCIKCAYPFEDAKEDQSKDFVMELLNRFVQVNPQLRDVAIKMSKEEKWKGMFDNG